jgi:hypothetical protein
MKKRLATEAEKGDRSEKSKKRQGGKVSCRKI